MLRTMGFSLLCVLASLSAPSYSLTIHSLQQGVTIEYDLPPQEPQLFINYMFWAIEARCKITMEDKNVDLFAKAIAKKGKINDIPLTAGQSLQLNVRIGESLKLNADSGAKVEITNLSNRPVHATCTS